MGRPKKEINWDKLNILCAYPLVNEDIAALLDLSVSTIHRAIQKKFGIDFEEYKRQKQSTLRYTLLAKQIEVAKNGNVTMLIWLGKQYLNQSEKVEEKSEVTNRIKIDIEDNGL